MEREVPQPSTSRQPKSGGDARVVKNGLSIVKVPGMEMAESRADSMILDAEHFKAAIAAPPGLCMANQDNNVNDNQIGNIIQLARQDGISDDEFFHLTCHIDKQLSNKIERGEFVDLEKLLPKERGGIPNPGSVDGASRLEWIYKDGHTFLMPANDKIQSNHKF